MAFVLGHTYLHQTLTEYVSNQYTHFDSDMPDVTVSYCIFYESSYIIDEHSCLKYFIFTKLSQIMCLINAHILVYQHAKCDCKLWEVL